MEDCLGRYEDLISEINKIRFNKLEEAYIGYTLSYPLAQICLNSNVVKVGIGSIIFNLIVDKYKFEINGNGKISFFITHRYIGRQDHLKTMLDIARTCGSSRVLKPVIKKTITLRNIIDARLIIRWLFQLRSIQVNIFEKLFLVANIYIAYKYLKVVKPLINSSTCKGIVVRMDGQLLDNIICQYAKACGIKTVTIQDGTEIFRTKEAYTIDKLQAKLRGSVSDYCLAWCDYYKTVIESVVPRNQSVRAVGMPKYIGYKKTVISNMSKPTIGVMLDYHRVNDSNSEMLEAVKRAAKSLDYNYLIKYHPSESKEHYKECVDERCIFTAFGKCDLLTFLEKCNIVIGCNSSTVYESAYINRKTYRFRPVNSEDILSDTNYPVIFHNDRELIRLITEEITVPTEYVSYYCSPEEIERNYNEFFNELLATGNLK